MLWYEVDWPLTLEFQKVWASWPPLAALMLAVFFWRFHAEIRTFLTNIRPRGPGFEPMLPEQLVGPTPAHPLPESEPESEGATELPTPAAEHAPAPPPAPNSEIERVLEKHQHFRYLNNLLVFTTQSLLDLIVEHNGLSTTDYTRIWPTTPADQKSNMLAVLYQQGLVTIVGDRIAPTDKGRDYYSWSERIAWVNVMKSVWSNAITPALTPPTKPLPFKWTFPPPPSLQIGEPDKSTSQLGLFGQPADERKS